MLNIQLYNSPNNYRQANFGQNSAKFSQGNFAMQKSGNDSFIAAKKSLKNPSFGTLFRINASGRIIDTAFLRGEKTMRAAAKFLNEIKEETSVLHYGGSTAEEALTNRIILKNPNCKVVSLDIDPEAVDLARKGIHSVIVGHNDSFLLRTDYLTEEQKEFKAAFDKMFSPTERPDFVLNNKYVNDPNNLIKSSDEHFFRLNDDAKEFVEIRDANEGNIFASTRKERVSALYARNFLNQLTGNNIKKVMMGEEKPAIPNTKILDEIASAVYKKLDDNGWFVVGNFIGEHIFLAAVSKPGNIKMNQSALYRGMDFSTQLEVENLEIFKVSPLQAALEKGNKFKPVFFDSLEGFPQIKVPTIWQKIPKNS